MHPRAEGLDRFVLFAILGIAIVSVGCGGSADSSLPRAPDASSAASVDASASPVDASDAEARSDADAGGIGDSSVDARVDSGSIDGSNASPDAMACSPGIDAGGDCGPSEPAPCDSTHCPAGCCDANGTCQSGGSPAACGAGGAACQTCPAGSECFDCPAGTDCETARFCGCGPESCPSGCCTGGGEGRSGELANREVWPPHAAVAARPAPIARQATIRATKATASRSARRPVPVRRSSASTLRRPRVSSDASMQPAIAFPAPRTRSAGSTGATARIVRPPAANASISSAAPRRTPAHAMSSRARRVAATGAATASKASRTSCAGRRARTARTACRSATFVRISGVRPKTGEPDAVGATATGAATRPGLASPSLRTPNAVCSERPVRTAPILETTAGPAAAWPRTGPFRAVRGAVSAVATRTAPASSGSSIRSVARTRPRARTARARLRRRRAT